MPPLVALSNVTVGFPGHPVLQGLSFQVQAGDRVALLGPNGCGKSALLKTLLGILPPLSGQVRLEPATGGRCLAFGYVPQRGTLEMVLPLTVQEVVQMGIFGRLRPGQRVGPQERHKLSRCLEEVGAADLSRRPFGQLSGGQQQRVLIARALVGDPDLLVLDEPLAGVDPQTVETIVTLLGKLTASMGLTLLWASHHLPAVRKVVREVIWIDRGRLVRGPVAEMLAPDRIRTLLQAEGLIDEQDHL